MSNKKHDLTFSLRRIAYFFLALVMAGCVVLSVSVGISSGLLRDESFVQKRFEKYNSQLLDEVNTAIAGVADTTGLPTKAYTGAIQEGHIRTALHQAANNIVKGYDTDYTESKYLYGYYRTGLLNYCKENGIPITEDELVRDSCFAVDVFNDTVGDESTKNIIIFALTYTNKPLMTIIFSVLIFIACAVIIDFTSYGKHKKFDYMGMGLITAGEAMVILPIFALLMKYTSTLRFMDIDVYNMALADVLNDILKIIMAFGAVILVIGIVMAAYNYRYYSKKTEFLRTEHNIRAKLIDEQRESHKEQFARAEMEAIDRDITANDKEKSQ